MNRDEHPRPEREARRQRYLDGEMDAQERRRFEEELLASDAEAEEIWAELQLRELERERRGSVASGRPRPRRLPRRFSRRMVIWPAAVAVAAALVLWLQTPVDDGGPPVFRDAAMWELQALRPVGEVDAPPSLFAWTAVAAADSYRFELFDADSRQLFSTVTADTVLELSGTAEAPEVGYWVVTGVDEVGAPVGEPVTSWFEARR